MGDGSALSDAAAGPAILRGTAGKRAVSQQERRQAGSADSRLRERQEKTKQSLIHEEGIRRHNSLNPQLVF